MLFYHDHGMHSTTYNVKHGLAGLYIIYDNKIEYSLPKIN
jgi:FtsP/CotA-like multicopper oxidase with cupredoxin domain